MALYGAQATSRPSPPAILLCSPYTHPVTPTLSKNTQAPVLVSSPGVQAQNEPKRTLHASRESANPFQGASAPFHRKLIFKTEAVFLLHFLTVSSGLCHFTPEAVFSTVPSSLTPGAFAQRSSLPTSCKSQAAVLWEASGPGPRHLPLCLSPASVAAFPAAPRKPQFRWVLPT